MATNTYVALSTTTLGSDVTSFTISSIPTTYTDLVVVGVFNTDSVVNLMTFQVGNSTVDPNANYSHTALRATGSAASSNRFSNETVGYISHTQGGTTTAGGINFIANFQNYSNTTTHKTVLTRANQVDGSYPSVELNTNLWRSTAAINTIKFAQTGGAVIKAGSTFTLYGIAATPVAVKATGGTVYHDINSGYVYHKFTSSGTFTPTSALSADILVVGGGGSGYCGGGGAGGVVGLTAQSLTTIGYTITVGQGGAGGVNSSSPGTGSQFGTLTAAVGGGRGGYNDIFNNTTYSAGGSGGGGGGSGSGTTSGGSGTAGQGYAGGGNGGFLGYPYGGGGGGGAGEAGQNATAASAPGRGGNGTYAYADWAVATSSGASGYFAGGGGSAGQDGSGANGAGGLGGGAAGTAGANNPGATINTGGGGGGVNSGTYRTGNGGSGIVIIRYLA